MPLVEESHEPMSKPSFERRRRRRGNGLSRQAPRLVDIRTGIPVHLSYRRPDMGPSDLEPQQSGLRVMRKTLLKDLTRPENIRKRGAQITSLASHVIVVLA